MNAFIKIICTLLLPFIILLGLYIIVNGDISPGGGFQGGVVMASSYVMIYLATDQKTIPFKAMAAYEKWAFLLLIVICIIVTIEYQWFLSLVNHADARYLLQYALILLNTAIGFKVTLGLISIMEIFVEEGEV